MKKFIVVMSIMLIAFSATAQKKKGKKGNNNDCYLSEAVATFNLSEEDKAELNDLLTENLQKRAAVRKAARAEEITKDEVKSKNRANNQAYFKKFADLTGKSKKEVMEFEKETRKKCSGK